MHKLIVVLFCVSALSVSGQQKTIDPAGINLENIQYPFPVKFIGVNIQGEKLRMAYMDVAAEKPNGKIVMLLHGKNFNGAYWESTAKELRKNGYRVIIPDQIGFGKSSKPKRIQYTFHLLALQTKKLLDTLGITEVNVLGHSMGGMLATRFALMYPSIVSKLILNSPIGLEDWKLKVPYQTVEEWFRNEIKQNYNTMKKYQQENYYHGTWRADFEKWLMIPVRLTMNADYPLIAWNSALVYDMIFTQPVYYEFEQLSMPTLLIIGELDKTALGKNLVSEEVRKTMGNYPELGKQAVARMKNAKLVSLPLIGHLPHIESFDK
ncbi:MAG TPA: alpha/beta hydrolase, partial [Chitinophagaceae bacterium]|nr:alpha/beta hydrolase [Chitinophagaceae bacterium]